MAAQNQIFSAGDEKKVARLHLRTQPSVKALIERAASLSGVDNSTYTLTAAYKAALETVADHAERERTVLEPVDHEAFFAALDEAAPAPRRLVEAMQRHAKTVTPARDG